MLTTVLAAAQAPSSQLALVEAIRDVILSPGGAVALLVVFVAALFYRRVIPKGTHDAEIAALKAGYEVALEERDKTIEKVERRAERWEQYAILGRRTLRDTLEAADAPTARAGNPE